MIQIHSYPTRTGGYERLNIVDLEGALKDKKRLLWISLENPDNDELLSILRDIFRFHPLSIEDCQSLGYQTPKLDDYGDYLFMIFEGVVPPADDIAELQTTELDLYLGPRYLVTVFYGERFLALEKARQRLEMSVRQWSRADHLCHTILDAVVDEYLPVLEIMNEQIDRLEDEVLVSPTSSLLNRVLQLKHTIMAIRRIIAPEREILNRISRGEFSQISENTLIYYRDIYDHLVQDLELCEVIRELVISTLDIYLNSTSLRLNGIMKALTIVSTIFLPLSFLAGVYGMNFKHMPEVSWIGGYPMAWFFFLFIAIGMLVYFKRRGWF